MKNRLLLIKKTLIFSITFYCTTTHLQAQLINATQLKISPETLISVYFDFNNTATGEFINDGQVHIFNHWTNDGLVDFTASERGKTYFTGKQEQIIDGAPSSLAYTRLKNVVFNNDSNSSSILLATDITISGNVNFQKGIVDADSFNGKVIFENNGTHTNASSTSFVDGKVMKIGNSAFEYPVGDASYYRPSLHGDSNADSDVYTSHYFFRNPDVTYPHLRKQDKIKLIDNKEYWEISKDSGTTNNIITLTLNPETTPSYIYDKLPNTNIQIVRWDVIAGQWVSEGGVIDEVQKMVTTQVSDYGVFTLARVTKIVEEREVDLVIYNAVSPNGDDKNDFFYIKGIDKYPDNTVEVFNRWGILVYETKGYNESDRVFRGFSDGRATVTRSEGLPTGTYYYILKYNTGKQTKEKAGYLYINQDN